MDNVTICVHNSFCIVCVDNVPVKADYAVGPCIVAKKYYEHLKTLPEYTKVIPLSDVFIEHTLKWNV